MSGGRTTVSSRLRHRLTLQQEVQTPDGAGGYVRNWQDMMDLWAEIMPLTGAGASARGGGREILFADQIEAEITHKIMVRYQDGITPDMRFVYENRIFNIRAVANVAENRETLEILAQEGVAG